MTTDAALPAGAELAAFDFDPRTRVIYGAGVLSRLGELSQSFGRRAFLVTDSGLKAAGHEEHALAFLKQAGVEVVYFDDVHPNPTTDDVDRAMQVARDAEVDLIIGLGGGSSMDCA